ncbi:MAG: DUF1566 domain-containing protein [Deltaproteobacteria bacterium]|nr:DUF1566 domain-containing protein [Deltaproteobacteria bacterium]
MERLCIALWAVAAWATAACGNGDAMLRVEEWKKSAPEGAGIAKEPGTDTPWLRCAVGQTLSGSACTGEQIELTWEQARGACPQGFRLPTRSEMARLLGDCDEEVDNGNRGYCASCAKSGSCKVALGTDQGSYWTSTTFNYYPSWAWYADFRDGNITNNGKSFTYRVRCVGGQPDAEPPERAVPWPQQKSASDNDKKPREQENE